MRELHSRQLKPSRLPQGQPARTASDRSWWRITPLGEDALERFGENGALRGLSLRATLREYGTSADHNRSATVGTRIERSAVVAKGWRDVAMRGSASSECTDATSDLATVGYLRGRAAEAYRSCTAAGQDPAARFVLVVLSAPVPPVGDLDACVAQVVRTISPFLIHGETAARCGPSAIVILRERRHETAVLLRAVRAALATAAVEGWRVWTERLSPTRQFFGSQLHEIMVASQNSLLETQSPRLHRGRADVWDTGSAAKRLDRSADSAAFEASLLIGAARGNADELRAALERHGASRDQQGATFEEVIEELRTVREMLALRDAEHFDCAETVAAVVRVWESEPDRIAISAAVDPLLGLATPGYFGRRIQEIAVTTSIPIVQQACLAIYVKPEAPVDEFGVLMRIGGALRRIFRHGETVARLDRNTIVVVGLDATQLEKCVARVDSLLAQPWACGIVVGVQQTSVGAVLAGHPSARGGMKA